ncbi:MAG: hypothetical protein IJZ95_07275 [Oscillospiraceae bacterium]|nr:hypothetical protein [Oscillospiraceae bacterium]
MMHKIRIQRNIKRIEVNDNGEYIELDFDDLNLPYRYYNMIRSLEHDRAEFMQELADKIKDKSDSEISEEMIEAERKLNIYFRDKIDEVFGEGTCRKCYGDILPSLDMHIQLFDALTPYFEEEAQRRRSKMNRYSARRTGDAL